MTTEHSKPVESGERAELTPEFLADLVPQTATILEMKDGSHKTCFTYAEVKQFAVALLAADDKAGGYAKALEIRTEQGWKLTGEAIPVLYTDAINGQQVCRDDVWLCTTAALSKTDDKAGGEVPTEHQILNACEEAGLWPNTAASWVQNGAFRRYHEAINRMLGTHPQPQAEAARPCTLKECNGAMACRDCAQQAELPAEREPLMDEGPKCTCLTNQLGPDFCEVHAA